MSTFRSRRLFAPLALAGCILAVALIAMTTLGGDGKKDSGASKGDPAAGTSTSERSSATRRSTYTVKSGDSLSLIAEKTGVPTEDLVVLNAGVDPQNLRTGQKLKLRER